ncbi:MAG: ATP-binding protein [Thermodesulfobacteriota bacterium]
MIYISGKEIEVLNEEKLQVFLQKRYRENRFLDYKLKYEKDSKDEAKEEFLADVTGFANYYGGNIIIGVGELKEEGASSQPGELAGIEDGVKEAEAYRNLCDTSIDPPIPGLVIKELPLKNGKWAVVVYVPASLRRPHMVTFKGKNRFSIRRDDRTLKMTTDEVKRTVMEVVNLEKNLESYIKTVEDELNEDFPFLKEDFSLIMHAVPYLLEEDQVDTSSEEIKNLNNYSTILDPNNNVHHIDLWSGTNFTPTLRGIFRLNDNISPSQITYVHRTGYIGFVYNLKADNTIHWPSERMAVLPWIQDVFSIFLKLSQHVVENAKIASPYQIRCSFINSAGARYCYNSAGCYSATTWKRNRLNLPGVRIDSFQNTEEMANLFFERLKNAFGLSK